MRPARALTAVLLLIAAGCQREKRDLRADPDGRSMLSAGDRQSNLTPGTRQPETAAAGTVRNLPASSPFTGNAYAISEGQRLYQWFNCAGCHANGGGGIGPSLMDKQWTYGGSPRNVYESVAKGRANGMPAWGAKVPEYQIWQLVAYVRSLSGDQPRSATPARQDSIQVQNTDIRKRTPAP
jgi:cytochrome c oxidase cbb3-type subunit 3